MRPRRLVRAASDVIASALTNVTRLRKGHDPRMDDRKNWEAQVRAVSWASLSEHLSDDIPIESLLLKLWDFPVDPNEKAKLYWKILGLVVDQGATFEISIAVARLLVAFVAEENAPYKDLACLLLTTIAIGDEDNELSSR